MFASTNFSALFIYMGHYGTLILLSFYLELIREFSPLTAGLLLTASLLLLSTLNEQTSTTTIAFLLGMLGAGVGIFAPTNTNANLASVPPGDRAMSNGILGMMRSTGQSVSLAIGTIFIGLYLFGAALQGNVSIEKYISAVDLFFVVGAVLVAIATFFAFRGRESAESSRDPA